MQKKEIRGCQMKEKQLQMEIYARTRITRAPKLRCRPDREFPGSGKRYFDPWNVVYSRILDAQNAQIYKLRGLESIQCHFHGSSLYELFKEKKS